MELTEGVYAFPQTVTHAGREVTFNPTAVETGRGLLLLDVGVPDAIDQLEDHLGAAGFDWADVWGCLLTHQDFDHASGLSAVVERAGPVTFAHPACAPFIDGRSDPIKGDEERYPPAPIDVEAADGTRFQTAAGPMEVIHTPGHTPGHVSLYFPAAKLLLPVDALTVQDGELSGPNEEFTPDLPTAIESVGRLADYDVERTFCYHGGLVEKGTGAIARIWQRLAE